MPFLHGISSFEGADYKNLQDTATQIFYFLLFLLLRMIYEGSTSSSDTLLEKDMSFSTHGRNIQQLGLEMYKVTKDLVPTPITSLLLQCSNNRHTRSQSDLPVPQVNTVYFGQIP